MHRGYRESPTLVIVQNRETQFDAPLYSLIHQQKSLLLEVIYTEPNSSAAACDQELGFSPQWDHLFSTTYPKRHLHSASISSIWRLSGELRRKNPSLILICGYYPRCQLLLAIFLRFRGQRIGLRSDNTLAHSKFNGLLGFFRRIAISTIQRLFHTWHPVGDQAHAFLRQISGANRPSYRFSYSVDNDWFARHSQSARLNKISFLHEMGWPDDVFIILGIMKWTIREDPITLVLAFQKLVLKFPRSRLILVGDGPLRQQVNSACCAFEGLICLPGYAKYSELPFWYGVSDVFVHPAPDEPWGVSVNEALACGLPVIAAEGVGAAAELLNNRQCGAIFSNGDFASLSDLLYIEANRADRQSVSDAAIMTVDYFHYRHTVQALKSSVQNT
jgi:glycosyltransferase involved in cell wall biosynthesis